MSNIRSQGHTIATATGTIVVLPSSSVFVPGEWCDLDGVWHTDRSCADPLGDECDECFKESRAGGAGPSLTEVPT